MEIEAQEHILGVGPQKYDFHKTWKRPGEKTTACNPKNRWEATAGCLWQLRSPKITELPSSWHLRSLEMTELPLPRSHTHRRTRTHACAAKRANGEKRSPVHSRVFAVERRVESVFWELTKSTELFIYGKYLRKPPNNVQRTLLEFPGNHREIAGNTRNIPEHWPRNSCGAEKWRKVARWPAGKLENRYDWAVIKSMLITCTPPFLFLSVSRMRQFLWN